MDKASKISRSATTSKFVTRPLGKGKAERFAAVEGLNKSVASKALAQKLADRGLKGDAYRSEIVRAFKKV